MVNAKCREIATYGATPYGNVPVRDVKDHVLKRGIRLTEPTGIQPGFWQLIRTCFGTEPEDRPTFEELLSSVSELGREALKSPNDPLRDVGQILQHAVRYGDRAKV